MIEELLQTQVEKLQKKRQFGINDMKAEFIVSVLIDTNSKERDGEHKILLSVIHNGYQYSRIIFPKYNNFEYMSLESEMEYLYNATI